MSIRSDYDDALDSFVNGQKRQFVKQFDELESKSDFIDYICDLGRADEVLEMLKSYFNIKAR